MRRGVPRFVVTFWQFINVIIRLKMGSGRPCHSKPHKYCIVPVAAPSFRIIQLQGCGVCSIPGLYLQYYPSKTGFLLQDAQQFLVPPASSGSPPPSITTQPTYVNKKKATQCWSTDQFTKLLKWQLLLQVTLSCIC